MKLYKNKQVLKQTNSNVWMPAVKPISDLLDTMNAELAEDPKGNVTVPKCCLWVCLCLGNLQKR